MADRAGAKWIVKGKASRLDFLKTNAAIRAGKALAESQIAVLLRNIRNCQPLRETQCGLQRIRQTLFNTGADRDSVHHDCNRVLFIFLQLDLLGELILVAVYHHTDIAAAAGLVKNLRMLTLTAANNRRQQLDTRALGQRKNRVDHLVHGLAADLPAALRAMRNADSGIEQSEIVVNLRHRTDCRTGVAVCRLLVDGNRRRKTADTLHIGLFHLPEELARIGRKRLHIAPLSFCVNRIKGERGLAGSADAGKYHHFAARDIHINAFEVVFTGTAHLDIFFLVCFHHVFRHNVYSP